MAEEIRRPHGTVSLVGVSRSVSSSFGRKFPIFPEILHYVSSLLPTIGPATNNKNFGGTVCNVFEKPGNKATTDTLRWNLVSGSSLRRVWEEKCS